MNRELKTIQVIFQIRIYQFASFLIYAKYRIFFDKLTTEDRALLHQLHTKANEHRLISNIICRG